MISKMKSMTWLKLMRIRGGMFLAMILPKGSGICFVHLKVRKLRNSNCDR